jgi:hypothetical protein
VSVFGSRAGIAHIPPGRALGSRPLVLTLVARIAKGLNEFNGAPNACCALSAQFRSVECDREPSWISPRFTRQHPGWRRRVQHPGMIWKILLQMKSGQFEELAIVNIMRSIK